MIKQGLTITVLILLLNILNKCTPIQPVLTLFQIVISIEIPTIHQRLCCILTLPLSQLFGHLLETEQLILDLLEPHSSDLLVQVHEQIRHAAIVLVGRHIHEVSRKNEVLPLVHILNDQRAIVLQVLNRLDELVIGLVHLGLLANRQVRDRHQTLVQLAVAYDVEAVAMGAENFLVQLCLLDLKVRNLGNSLF